VAATPLFEQVVHVFEVFEVPALVGGKGNGIGIFLNGCVHHFGCAAVVAQVNDLRTTGLYDAPHDVDGGIVAIE
jgi:hypothetical protein